jgi:HK97 family phage portal protein
MFTYLQKLSQRSGKERTQKASQFLPMRASFVQGTPQWVDLDYSSLTRASYQKNAIVYRAITLIARSAASVTWQLTHKGHIIDTHPLLTLLKQPNPLQGGRHLVEEMLSYLLLAGNSYVEAVGMENGGPAELYTLRPDRMKVVPGRGGVPEAYEYQVSGETKRLSVSPLEGHSALLHLKLFHPQNDWYGMSPLEAARTAIESHNTVVAHNISLLKNGGRPSGALFMNNKDLPPLSEEQRQDLRTSLSEAYQGSQNAGQIMILEGDFTWKEMGLSPKDMDFIEGKNVTAREIAQIFGVPPMLVGIPGDATFSNYREARLNFWEETVLPLLDQVTSQLNRWLTPHFGPDLELQYNLDQIPAIAAKREAQWEKMNQCNFLTPNEKRAAFGYPPVSGGDKLTSQS